MSTKSTPKTPQAKAAPKGSWVQRSRKFLSEVRKEVSQVVWPTRRETAITTVIVGIFAFVVSVYLLAVDNVLIWVVQKLIG